MGSASLNRLSFGGLAFQKKGLRELAMYANLESAEILEPGAVNAQHQYQQGYTTYGYFT